jgi:hypothetical protein
VVRVLGYRSGGLGSIPGTTRKKSSGPGTGSTQSREYNWGATWYKSSGSCLQNREYGRRDLSHWPRGTLYPQKLAITSPTSGSRSVDIVRSQTQTIEFSFSFYVWLLMSVFVSGVYWIDNSFQYNLYIATVKIISDQVIQSSKNSEQLYSWNICEWIVTVSFKRLHVF